MSRRKMLILVCSIILTLIAIAFVARFVFHVEFINSEVPKSLRKILGYQDNNSKDTGGDSNGYSSQQSLSDGPFGKTEILPLPKAVIRDDAGQKVDNDRVEELRKLYLRNASIKPGDKDASPRRVETVILKLQDGEFKLLEGKNAISGDLHYRDIYLASLSKEFITDVFMSEVEADNLDKVQKVSIYVLIEMIRRSKGQRLIDEYDEYRDILNNAGINYEFLERWAGSDEGAELIISKIRSKGKTSFELDYIEVIKIILKYSCNYATAHIDAQLRELAGGPDEYYEYMIEKHPGFHAKKGLEDGLHFVQYDANTGDMIGLMKFQNQLAVDYLDGNLAAHELEIFIDRIDNDHDFAFNLGAAEWLDSFVENWESTSELAENNYKMHFIEKTGYYPSVYWIENQGEYFPPFMFMGSVFTIFIEADEDGELVSGGQANGDQADGGKTDGDQADGGKTDGDQADGDQADGVQIVSEQTDTVTEGNLKQSENFMDLSSDKTADKSKSEEIFRPITFAYYEIVEIAHPDQKEYPYFWDGKTYSYEWSEDDDRDYILPIKYGLAKDFREKIRAVLLHEF